MKVVNSGGGDGVVLEGSKERKLDFLTEKELLKGIYIELKINNLHLAEMRGEELTEHDLEQIK